MDSAKSPARPSLSIPCLPASSATREIVPVFSGRMSSHVSGGSISWRFSFNADSRLPDLYVPLCRITADTSKVLKTPRHGEKGTWFVQEFDIVLQCGSTEMRAQISWMENVRALSSFFPSTTH